MRSRFNIVIPLVLTAILGCTPRAARLTLPLDTPQTFTEPGGTYPLQDRWWTAFSDSAVDTLVDAALQSNFSLESTWYRLQAAQAVVDRESSAWFPEITGLFEADADRGDGGDDETLTLRFSADYEIDLWGKIRSGIDAERYRARASAADYRAAALSLSAEVVLTWYELMEARSRLDLFDSQIETNEKALSLIRARFGSGQVRSVDILRQKQLIESTREQRLAAASRARVLEHQLSVLLGRPPESDVTDIHTPLPELPPLPETGLPASLIQRRPDIQRAHHLLRAADRDVAAAVSARYPRITLSASSTSTDNSGDGLFGGWAHNFAAGLLGPLFDGGRLGAEVDRNLAGRNQRLYDYGQTVLTALQEVENALVREKAQMARIESLESQLALTIQAYEQLRLEYLNGISDYLDVLTALTSEQRLRRDVISARTLLLEYRVSLYRALGGGFETPRTEDG